MDFESKEIVTTFLNDHYAKASHPTISNAILNHLFLQYNISNYTNVNYNHYVKLTKLKISSKLNESTFTNCEYFIKYLFANNLLENNENFHEEWLVKDILKHFEKSKNRINGNNKSDSKLLERKVLNIQELSKVKSYLEIETMNTDTYKKQFCWFLLFNMGLTVTQVKNIQLKDDYDNGYLMLATEELIQVPEKFRHHIEKHRVGTYDSFFEVNKWMKRLGEDLELGISLKPGIIKNTREQLLIECSNCSQIYLRGIDNWVALDGWIVCKECAEVLKKKIV